MRSRVEMEFDSICRNFERAIRFGEEDLGATCEEAYRFPRAKRY